MQNNYGLIIYDAGGRAAFTNGVKPFVLLDRIEIKGNEIGYSKTFQYSTPDNKECMVFLRCDTIPAKQFNGDYNDHINGEISGVRVTSSYSQGITSITVTPDSYLVKYNFAQWFKNAIFYLYVFTISTNSNIKPNYGLEIYDENNNVIYTSSNKILIAKPAISGALIPYKSAVLCADSGVGKLTFVGWDDWYEYYSVILMNMGVSYNTTNKIVRSKSLMTNGKIKRSLRVDFTGSVKPKVLYIETDIYDNK